MIKASTIKSKYEDGLLTVPCGKCLQCRIKKRKEWGLRMIHELDDYKKSCFITLTYDDDNIPEFRSLKKHDLQKFFKRVRKAYPGKIKYFACGEYGDKTQRPHYHAIIFGISITKADKLILNTAWPYGHIFYGLAEPDSINYVAQYIDKKYSGDLAKNEYEKKHRESVFRFSSNGLGLNYVYKNADRLLDTGYITLWGKKLSLPRYYIKKLEEMGLDTSHIHEHAYDSECDLVEHYTGFSYSLSEAYRILTPELNIKMCEGIRKAKAQHNATLEAKVKMRVRKI